MFFLIYITYEYIQGVKTVKIRKLDEQIQILKFFPLQKNHLRMKMFKSYCFAYVALVYFRTVFNNLLVFYAFRTDDYEQMFHNQITSEIDMFLDVFWIVSFGWSTYSYICISSLYMTVKEERVLRNVGNVRMLSPIGALFKVCS